VGHVYVVRVLNPELRHVPGKDQQAPLGDVGGDHLQLVAVPQLDILAADQVPEGALPLGLQQPAHPLLEGVLPS
jgi:hypothetical protein